METNTNNEMNEAPKINMNKMLKIGIIFILLLSPVVFLIIKSSGTPEPPPQQTTVNQTAKVDIAALERIVNSGPTLDNLNDLGMAYINNQLPGKSISYFKRALEFNQKNAIVLNNLGVAYIMVKQYQEGIDACTKAVSADPTMQLAKNNLKWGLDEKAKVMASVKTFEDTPVGKRNIAYYMDYGMVYFKAGNYDKSIEIWSKIGDIDKKNTDALNNIGTAFMMKNQVDDAIALFKKATELNPTNQLAKNNLAWAMDEKTKAAASVKK